MTQTNTPNALTFEAAIAQTQSLITQMEAGSLAAADLQAALTDLVSSENGARGFFVTYLTDERTLADHPTAAVVQALQTSPEIVSELLVKNLAMSSAMAIAHRRNGDADMAQGSDRVKRRTAHLIHLLQLPQLQEKASQLLHSVTCGGGVYQTFLDRWGYDDEQRKAIQAAIAQVIQ